MDVIIADDENLVRASLKSMLLELDMKVNVAAEAKNGEELVTAVKKYHPDLVYVDIKMPKMSGLDAIKSLKEECSETQWIILTGFSVFEYAKEALELGVKKYLLKPVSVEDLRDSVKYVLESKKEKCQKLNFEFEHDMSAIYNRIITLDDISENNAIFTYKYLGAILLPENFPKESGSTTLQKDFWNKVFTLRDSLLNSDVRITFIPLQDGNFTAIFAWNPQIDADGKNKAREFIKELIKISKESGGRSFCESLIYGSEYANLYELYSEIKSMQKLIPLKIEYSYGESISFEALQKIKEGSDKHSLKIAESIYNITELFKSSSYYEYLKGIEDLEYYFNANGLKIESLKPFTKYLIHSYNIDSKKISSPKNSQEFFRMMKSLIEDKLTTSVNTADLVNNTISFINHHYMDDIGIAQIAGELDVTPNYLSSLFHKKTGENFVNYLTKTRLLKAREILYSSQSPRISQISKQVGYYTVTYFTKVYKKYFGFTPSQDLANHMSGNNKA